MSNNNFNPYNNGTNTINMAAGSFDDYDSIDGEFSIQMAQTDDESMAMSELGSVLGGASVLGSQQPPRAPVATTAAHDAEIQPIKSSEDEIYEDDSNASNSYDMPEDCASFMNSELGISAGDVSAILFGGRSANYNQGGAAARGEYMNGLFGSNNRGYDSNLDSNVNTSVDDTIGDLFARDVVDDNTVMDSIIGATALDDHLQIRANTTKLGPLGDELSYAQDDSTAPPAPEPLCAYNAPTNLHVEIDVHDEDEMEEEEVTRGILPVWLSTSNSRMKSLLVVSAALIVGSLVMAVVALGANSHWWAADESGKGGGEGMASFSSEMNEDSREINLFGEPTMFPSFKPTQKKTEKPTTRKPTKSPVLEETGETIVNSVATKSTAAAEVDTTTSEATSTTSTTTEMTTAVATDAPTVTITPSTQTPMESPTLMPSDATSNPVSDSPTLSK
jgi:hypothetical protein